MVSVKDGPYLGIIGEFRPSVRQALKLPKYCAGFEVDTTTLQEPLNASRYFSLPRFPKVTQDMTLKVPADLTHQDLFGFILDELDKAKGKNTILRFGPIDIFQSEQDKRHKNITFRVQVANYERTLTDSEVNKLLDVIASATQKRFKAERV